MIVWQVKHKERRDQQKTREKQSPLSDYFVLSKMCFYKRAGLTTTTCSSRTWWWKESERWNTLLVGGIDGWVDSLKRAIYLWCLVLRATLKLTLVLDTSAKIIHNRKNHLEIRCCICNIYKMYTSVGLAFREKMDCLNGDLKYCLLFLAFCYW